MLLDYGGDPNFKESDDQTPVTIHSRHPCTRILLDKGADPTIPNNYGKSVKTLALDLHNQKMVDLFEMYTIDISLCVAKNLIPCKIVHKI
jgi:hypothetical protein